MKESQIKNELVVKNELANLITLVEHNRINGGEQYIFDCGNGFGASVASHMFSYGGDSGLWELLVIKFNSNGEFSPHYDNDITNGDVLGYLEESEVMDILEKISRIS